MLRMLCGVLACALLGLAPRADAATVGERSPVRPGLWWDSSHNGSGFEIHAATGQLFVIWYTYRSDGSAIWYTAQGPMSASGRFDATLLRHRWTNGRYAGSTAVGTLALSRQHSERVHADWTLDGAGGRWELTPYTIAGATPEIDHSGAWYDPAAAGFGLTVGEQGPWLTGAYYVYDADGEPTWSFGTNGGSGTALTLERFRGACPACSSTAPSSQGTIGLQLGFRGETQLNASIADDRAVLAPEWRRGALALSMITLPGSRRAADRALASFDDGARLKDYVRAAFLDARPPPSSGLDFSAAPPPATFSSTNLVESGVDEADGVKTDGRYVYAVGVDEYGQSNHAVRIASIDGAGPQLSIQPPIALTRASTGEQPDDSRLYLSERQLIAVSTTRPRIYFAGPVGILPPESYEQGKTRVEIFDRANPARPRSTYYAELDGSLVSSRRIGEQLYLVHHWSPTLNGYQAGATDGAAVAQNRALLDAAPVEQFLPRISVDGAAALPMLAPEAVWLPPSASILPGRDLVCVTRINLGQPSDRETVAVIGTVETVYVSTTRMYLATTRYEPVIDPVAGYTYYGYTSTDIHQLALDGGHPRIAASGAIEGYIGRDLESAPFRLSERAGKLRVISSGSWGELGQNRLTVLEPSTIAPGVLRTVSTLPNRARPQPIGKPDEHLYATRFVDDKLYAVTYFKIDPLYVVALTPESDPRIAGAVELPGFSEYLHPLPNGLLLGFGKDSVPGSRADDRRFDWYQGLKLALFDVSNPAAPRTLDQRVIGKRGSESALLRDHHAFSGLMLGDSFRFAIPMRIHAADGTEPYAPPPDYYYPYRSSGLYAFDIDTARPSSATIAAYPPLITDRANSSGYVYDDAAAGARSVLLPSGAIYVEKSRFWFAPWSETDKPVGPL